MITLSFQNTSKKMHKNTHKCLKAFVCNSTKYALVSKKKDISERKSSGEVWCVIKYGMCDRMWRVNEMIPYGCRPDETEALIIDLQSPEIKFRSIFFLCTRTFLHKSVKSKRYRFLKHLIIFI